MHLLYNVFNIVHSQMTARLYYSNGLMANKPSVSVKCVTEYNILREVNAYVIQYNERVHI